MLWPKESGCAGKSAPWSNRAVFGAVTGLAGAVIVFTGLFRPYPTAWFIAGSLALLASSIAFRLVYFIALELILGAGHSAELLGIGDAVQLAIPVLLSLQILVYYGMSGKLNNGFLWIGIAGIALLSVGFSWHSTTVFFMGSLAVSVYAFYCAAHEKQKAAYIWAVLNLGFACRMIYLMLG